MLGLRLVTKTVNQDDPTVYHLFYADEDGDPGSDITFFEYPGAIPGRNRSRVGAPHHLARRLSWDALAFWADRLGAAGVEHEADGESVRFADPEGLGHELRVSRTPPTRR